MNFKKLFLMLTFFVLLGTTAFAQTTWYVNNGPTGNDGRNGLSATIPVPDDFVTGPKKTISNAISSANANDVIVVAFTGVDYGTGTGEPATITVNKVLNFQSSGGTPNIGSIFEVATGALANKVSFTSGPIALKGGLTLTSGTLDNSSSLVTVSGGTVTVAAVNTTTKVTGQLAFSGAVSWNYTAAYTTADEFPNAGGTINNFSSTAAVTVKSGSSVTMTGVFGTGGALNLGGNTWTITNTAGGGTHVVGGNISNGTLAFQLGGGAGTTQTINGAFALPNVSVTVSNTNAQTLAIAQPTAISGTLTVSSLASVTTSAALASIGAANFTGDAVVLNGTGTITLSGAPITVNGNVLLSSAVTAATGSQIVFNSAGAVTVKGNVTNNASLTVSNANTWNGATSGRIIFPDQALEITGNVVNGTTIGGAYGTTTDVDGFGVILFQNSTTAATIKGAINNTSSTSLAGTTNPTDFSGNGLITWGNALTSGIVRADGGINNSTDFSGITGAANVNNGQIIIGGAARTGASTVGTAANPVGLVTNSSKGRAAGDGNGNITIGVGDGTSSGFYGTSINVTGTVVGGYTTFGNELFNVTGNITNSRTHASTALAIGVGGTAAKTVTVGGNIVNQGTNTTSFVVSTTGAVAVTGTVQSSTNGTITWPNITTGTIAFGGISVSLGTVTVPATHNAALTVTGAVDISGGTVTLACNGGDALTLQGTAAFTGGTFTTTGRTAVTFRSSSITIGGATTNPTFSGEQFTIEAPVPTAQVNLLIGSANPTIPGNLTINNGSGLSTAVVISGGSTNILGKLYFQAGVVQLTGSANLIVKSNSGTNDFQNTAGYTTDDNARVTVNAATPQVSGNGSFGNIEFYGTGGTIDLGTPITVKGTVYLTDQPVDNSTNNITFNNTTTLPTIVRNGGSFLAVPIFTSNVNVTYIGGDKSSGNELPTTALAPTKLQNLTVATSTGNVAGKGVVTIANGTTVNGTINVYANQALLIDGVDLIMEGSAITLNGDIANEGAGKIVFSATNGTIVTGAGYLPNLSIDAGSAGNMIAGKAIINQLVGTDNVRSGDDFVPTTTAAQGSVTFVAGTNNATFNLTGVAFDGSMAGAVTTAGVNNTMILGGNFVATGALTHTAGTINIDANTFEQRGAAVTLGATADALFAGTGKLLFKQADATTNTSFTLTANAGGSAIAVNTELNNADADAGEDNLTLAGGPLTISGNFTITDGELVLGQNLTLTGSAFTIAAAGSESGAGILRLNAATAPMTFTYSGTPTVANLRISNDVNLAGNGTALTVSTGFTHDGGVLNFGTRNLTFQTAFTRTAGTYDATTGYMILDANAPWTVDQGDGFTIPNLRFTSSGAANLALSNAAGRGNITVSGTVNLVMGANTLTTNGKLALADGATFDYTNGAVSATPTYAGGINLTISSLAGIAIPANIWPTTADLVQTLTINSAAAADVITLPGNRTIYGTNTLDLRVGTLSIGANTLTLVSGTTIRRRQGGSVTVGATGALVFPADNNVNVVYEPTLATAGGDIVTGIELPAVLNNLTITRAANVANALITINSAATVNGTLTVNNNLTANAQLTAKGSVVIATDATRSNAVSPVVTFTQTSPLVFGGETGQILDVTGGQQIAWMKLNMTGVNPVLNVTGNLTVPNTGGLLFQNGILNMGTYLLTLPRPSVAGVTFNGLSFDRTGVTGTNVGHVVGKISRAANAGDGAAGTNGRFEFPSGTLSGQYRPAAITFTPSSVVVNPVSIVVSHVDSSPEGTVNLPLDGGDGVKIGNYPNFYWLIATTPSSFGSEQKFNIDLQANNIGYPYSSDSQLRIIRRMDGNATSNGWALQGTAANYSNYQVVTGADTTVFVRTASTIGGLVVQGSRFAIGVPTRAPFFTAPAVVADTVNEGETKTIQVTADPQDVGETVTYALVGAPSWASINTTTGLLTLTPGYTVGSATAYDITVRATDSGGAYSDLVLAILVVDANRAPEFTTAPATGTIKYGSTLTLNYIATDADGQDVTYSVTSDPVPSVAPAITAAGGVLTFTPAFADAGKDFTFTVVAADPSGGADTAATVVTVQYAKDKGDVVEPAGISSADAVPILQYVVGSATLTDEQKYYADVNGDGQIGALDASWVLYYAVNSSWPSAKMVASGSTEIGQLSKVSANVEQQNGELALPISFKNASGVVSVYAEFQLSGAVEYKAVNPRLPEGWQYASNFENGVLKVAMAGVTPLTEGTLATINVAMKDKEATGTIQGFTKLNDNIVNNLSAVKIKEIPAQFAISQNYPNPFNPTTSIKFAIPENVNVNLEVYNMLGQKVKTLINGEQEAGYYTVNWDGTNEFGSKVSSGIYIYRIIAGKNVSTMKMNLLK